MYLVSYLENERLIEASLGGRVTAEEVRVFGEEIIEVLEIFGPSNILLDYSRALAMDNNSLSTLSLMKDLFLQSGAKQIVSVPCNEHDLARHTSHRLHEVIDGKEAFVLDPESAHFCAILISLPEAA